MHGKTKAWSKSSNRTSRPSSSVGPAKSSKLETSEAQKPAPKPVLPASVSGSEDDEDEEETGHTGREESQASEDDDEVRSGDEEDDGDDDDDEGVDEEGMQKLMKALGEDGLDDIGQMQLGALRVEDEDEDEEDEDEEEGGASEAEEGEGAEEHEGEDKSDFEDVSDAEDEEEKEVALEDVESVDEDAVPRQKIVTNNKIALERLRDSIKLDPSLPWTETLAVTYPETITIDVNDDLNRELAFYKQALHGTTTARSLAAQHSLPFTRPADYFSEMVKSDEHMERIRQKLLDENAQIKRAEAKRREREGKKYGKQVQIEKMKERERSRKEMEERLKGLKRKHKDALPSGAGQDDEGFDIAVEDAIADKPRPSKRARTSQSKLSRKARDSKFGFGSGKGRRAKQNTKASTEKFDYAVGGGKGKKKGKGKDSVKSKRPGKSKRAAIRNR